MRAAWQWPGKVNTEVKLYVILSAYFKQEFTQILTNNPKIVNKNHIALNGRHKFDKLDFNLIPFTLSIMYCIDVRHIYMYQLDLISYHVAG